MEEFNMYLNHVLELTMVLDAEKFGELFDRVYNHTEQVSENRYLDQKLVPKGIAVVYFDKQYKKKVGLTINPNFILGGDAPNKNNVEKLMRKLEKAIDSYFGGKYDLDDFNFNGLVLTTDIDVGSREKVAAYVAVLKRIGKVKGFSPPAESWLDEEISLCLEGNSNGISFLAYDLEELLRGRKEEDQQMKNIIKKAAGLIRAEVRLNEPRTIRACTDEYRTTEQIAATSVKGEDIFSATFQRVVPFGDFYKKGEAEEIIRREVKDETIKRRMLRLVTLVPEKKSLLLAQKALGYRRIDDVMETFAEIEVSPVTLSKRSEVKHLKNLYKYM